MRKHIFIYQIIILLLTACLAAACSGSTVRKKNLTVPTPAPVTEKAEKNSKDRSDTLTEDSAGKNTDALPGSSDEDSSGDLAGNPAKDSSDDLKSSSDNDNADALTGNSDEDGREALPIDPANDPAAFHDDDNLSDADHSGYGTSVEPASDKGSDTDKTSAGNNGSATDKGSDKNKGSATDKSSDGQKNSAGYEGSAAVPDDITDPLEKIDYLRKQIIRNTAYYDSLDNSADGTWCFKRMKDHSPSGTYENFRIADYNACYRDTDVSDSDKVIYLTFDCGYPSDNTAKILDILAAHNAKASFFVTRMYLQKCSDYAIRMKEEGHAVCNHTVSHTDLTYESVEKIASEILDVAEYFYNVTGYEFDPYFRTPTGAYTKRLLSIIRDAGYKTVFWSIAYGDYDKNNQPAPGYVTDHFATYHHNGAIALMHNDSSSNVNELDAVLTLLEKEGYRFALLNELDRTR